MPCPGPGREEKHPWGGRMCTEDNITTRRSCTGLAARVRFPCTCVTRDCHGAGEKRCKSPKTKSSLGRALARLTGAGARLAAPSPCPPCPRPFAQQELGGGKPAPWDQSCSHGGDLHRACAKRIFSQIKCSSLVKFEHIPGTQTELSLSSLPTCQIASKAEF